MENRQNFQENKEIQKHRWLILIAVGLFTFMSTLDGSIVNIALPAITKDLNIEMNQAEWVVSIYLMVACATLPLFGKLGDSFGKIKLFKLGTLIFVVGSFLCGVPHSLTFLLVARIIQAIGASMTMATNSGIITEIFPLHERGRALGLIGSFVSLGSITGPGIGGLLLAKFSWPYIFWINVPFGILTILLGLYILPKDVVMSKSHIDYKGFILFTAFISLLFGSILLGQEIGFNHLIILILFVMSILFFIFFYGTERRQKSPLINFSLFKNKMFTVSLVTAVLIFVANFFINVILPFYLQGVRQQSAIYSGILMMVFPLIMVIGAPLSGLLTDKIGTSVLTLLGLVCLTLTQLLYMFLNETTPIPFFIFMMALMGLGNALFQAPNNTIVMSSVEKEDLGIAGSLSSLARNFGMVLGVALSTTILYSAMSFKLGEHVTGFIKEKPEVFIFGMQITFFGSFLICLFATLLTFHRVVFRKKI